jgi:hypothetical protein
MDFYKASKPVELENTLRRIPLHSGQRIAHFIATVHQWVRTVTAPTGFLTVCLIITVCSFGAASFYLALLVVFFLKNVYRLIRTAPNC